MAEYFETVARITLLACFLLMVIRPQQCLKIGVLLPSTSDITGTLSLNTIQLAVDKAKRSQQLVTRNIDVVYKNTSCNTKQALGVSVDLLKSEKVDLLLGPTCLEPIQTVGLLAAYLKTPVVTWTPVNDLQVSKGGENTVVSTMGSYDDTVKAIAMFLHHYSWNNVVAFSLNCEISRTFMLTMKKLSTSMNITITKSETFNRLSRTDIREALNNARSLTKVFVTSLTVRYLLVLMDEAQRQGMTSGGFVFINWSPTGRVYNSLTYFPGAHDLAKITSDVLLQIVNYVIPDEIYHEFQDNVTSLVRQPGYSEYRGLLPYLHDAVLLGLEMVKRRVSTRPRVVNNPDFLTGSIQLDGGGIRLPSRYSVFQVRSQLAKKAVAVIESNWKYVELSPLIWPSALPKEGYDCLSRDCGDNTAVIAGATVGSCLCVGVVVCFILFYRKFHLRKTSGTWLLDNTEVKIRKSRMSFPTHTRKKLVRMETRGTLGFGSNTSLDRNMLFGPIGNYRGSAVAVKTMQHRTIKLTPEIVADLNVLKELQHDNLNQFIGCSISSSNTYILFKYCSKGSLQDVLENDDININWMFKISFATDLSKGMEYIHKSILRSHGNLKSSNCVIDSRWVLKVTDYGAVTSQLQEPDDEMIEHEYYSRLLWTAPELLRLEKLPPKGTQEGDVYSFAIILSEIMLRCGAYCYNNVSSKEIITRVRNGEDPPYRPKVYDDGDVMDKSIRLMTSCWQENPESRPTFYQIKKGVIDLNGGKKTTILDNMIQLLEAYSNDLEDLVAERTDELAQEKRKTDRLLYQMLPPSVADQLKCGLSVTPESYEDVSIFFSDIIGFTSIAGKSKPLDVVDLLNDLYTTFDGIISRHDVYKVETIGDAYMCASGLPRRNGKRHSGEIANMALDLISAVTSFKISHMPEETLHLRVGLHTGSCAAGVVGRIMPRYCLFGDTVNMASRMETTSKALHIHLSTPMKESLEALKWGFITVERGFIPIKGKGPHKTYWLVGKSGYDKPLPEAMLRRQMNCSSDDTRAPSPTPHYLNVGGMYSAVLRKASLSMSNLSDISCESLSDAGDDLLPDTHDAVSKEYLCLPENPLNATESSVVGGYKNVGLGGNEEVGTDGDHMGNGVNEDMGIQFQLKEEDFSRMKIKEKPDGPKVAFAEESESSAIPTIEIS